MSHQKEARKIVARAVNIPLSELPNEASLETLPAWDSIAHITIILMIEEHLGHQIPPEVIICATSLESITAILEDRENAG